MIIYYLRMIILLTVASMISPAQAAAVTCTSTSPQCCWVRRIYELMGKTTSVSTTNATACCKFLDKVEQSSGIAGVNCTLDGNVTKIAWKSIALSGSIPSDIGNLVELRYLDLFNNTLTGAIPSSLWNLTKLTYLKLANNQLTGSIPSSVGNLVELRFLYLQSNILTGSIPSQIGNLTKLLDLWLHNNKLTGSIPSQIGNLTNLKQLSNKLTGSIPPEIGKLKKLLALDVSGNLGINGTFTPDCGTKVYLYKLNTNSVALNTNITICGCASKGSPAFLFPPAGTPDACLASGDATSLQKRVLAFSQTIGSKIYTCNVDDNSNPFQDCLNAQAKICNPTYMGTDQTRLLDCKNGVDKMAQSMSKWWKAVRRECGQWPWIESKSSNCASANSDLISNAYYMGADGITKVYVTSNLTNSVNVGLWGNAKLNG